MAKSMDEIVELILELMPEHPYENRGYADSLQNQFIVDVELTEAVMERVEEQASPQLQNLIFYQVGQCRPEMP